MPWAAHTQFQSWRRGLVGLAWPLLADNLSRAEAPCAVAALSRLRRDHVAGGAVEASAEGLAATARGGSLG